MTKRSETRRDAHPSSYREAVEALWANTGIWDYLRYDEAGDLWINGLRVTEAIQRFGTPLEIVDTTIIEQRSEAWFDLTQAVADELGYTGKLGYLYAAKANMAAEITHAAYRSGWNAETSAQQDLDHLRWMRAQDLLPNPDMRVVCNGFKLPAACYGFPTEGAEDLAQESRVHLPHKDTSHLTRDAPYADTIRAMRSEGWDIMPILDEGELQAFAAPDTPNMDVGLRLKFGKVGGSRDRLDSHLSRFGFGREAIFREAARIAKIDHLRLTTMHAMVGAAETIPVPRFVESLRLAGEIWAELKQAHPSLRELNIGGGVPPLGEDYDHRAFLAGTMRALMEVCETAGVPVPDLTFEFGSLVTAESAFHVFKVMQRKRNHVGEDQLPWAIVDGGLMAAIPDMLLIGKSFRFLAAGGADAAPVPVRLGDLSCDSDGRYPPEDFGTSESVLLPDREGPNHLVVQGVGAYQEILSGVRGAHHCGLLEAIEFILERQPDGSVRGRLMPRQRPQEAAEVLGYTEGSAAALRDALGR